MLTTAIPDNGLYTKAYVRTTLRSITATAGLLVGYFIIPLSLSLTSNA